MVKFNRLICIPFTFILIACTSQQKPYEKISKHYVYQIANEESSPNFQTNINTSIQLIIPFFKQFYDLGIEDKKNNISQREYDEKIAYLSSDAFIDSIESKEQYVSEKVHVETKTGVKDKKEKKIIVESIIEAYKAGYHGSL